MRLISRVSRIRVSACARKYLIGIYCLAAVFLCEISFLSAAAWSDSLVYHDLESGIYSNAQETISFSFMRHIWIASDGVMAVAVQKGGYEGQGIVLYKTLDEGLHWIFEAEISSGNHLVSDGIIDENNNILFVTSLANESRTADVNFIRMNYDSISHAWSIDPLTPATVVSSGPKYRATRASIAVDSNGVIWCAFRLENTVTGIFNIRVKYSVDGGATWNDSANTFGTTNNLRDKCAKVIAVNSRIALIYQDVSGSASAPERFKKWAYREDSQPLQDVWTSGSIAKMTANNRDPYGSHWSVAPDDFGNIHMSYEDNGINYLKYDAAVEVWTDPLVAATNGSYSNISVAPNNDLYLFRDSPVKKIAFKKYSSANQQWTRWFTMSSKSYEGVLKLNSPEKFNDHLPLFHRVNARRPYQLIYYLLDTQP